MKDSICYPMLSNVRYIYLQHSYHEHKPNIAKIFQAWMIPILTLNGQVRFPAEFGLQHPPKKNTVPRLHETVLNLRLNQLPSDFQKDRYFILGALDSNGLLLEPWIRVLNLEGIFLGSSDVYFFKFTHWFVLLQNETSQGNRRGNVFMFLIWGGYG